MRVVVALFVAVLALVLLVAPYGSAQDTTILPEPFEFPPCDVPKPVPFAQVEAHLENLEFDGAGNLFLTAFEEGLYGARPDGSLRHIAASPREPEVTDFPPLAASNAFMGVTLGADGALYVSEGHAVLGPPVDGRVLRFPVPGEEDLEVFATGFPNTNGLASDTEGNLYLAHGFRDELWKIHSDGTWDVWTRIPDIVNGLVEHPDGKRLVIAPIGDPAQSVIAIPFDDPEAREVLFRFNAAPSLTGPALPDPSLPLHTKGIDDLAVAADGRILISAHQRNQFVMADPETGEACILLDDTRGEASSVRIATGFGDWDGWAFTTDFSGDVWAIDIGTEEEPATRDAEEHDPEAEVTPAIAPILFVVATTLAVARLRRPHP